MTKIFAYIFMFMDHSAIFFFPEYADSLRFYGSAAFPLFAYFIVQGFKHTADLKQYMYRLFLFALITEPLFAACFPGRGEMNILFTLLTGLICLRLYEKYQTCLAFGFCLPLLYLNSISFYVVLIFIFYFTYDDRLKMFFLTALFFIPLAYIHHWYLIGGLLYFPLISISLPRFNINKYFYYAVYPAHFAVILLLRSM